MCARTVFYAFPVARMLHDATAECRHCHTTINHKYKYTRVCKNRAQIYEIPRLLTTMARRSSSVRITWHGSGPSASRRGNVNKAHTSCLRRTVFRGLMHKPLDRRLRTHTQMRTRQHNIKPGTGRSPAVSRIASLSRVLIGQILRIHSDRRRRRRDRPLINRSVRVISACDFHTHTDRRERYPKNQIRTVPENARKQLICTTGVPRAHGARHDRARTHRRDSDFGFR